MFAALLFAVAAQECTVDNLVQQADAARVQNAVRTPETAWQFIIDPQTPLSDRIAAARAVRLPISYLPVVIGAMRELNNEGSRHAWGLHEHPYSAIVRRHDAIGDAGQTHTILGHAWTVPTKWSDYPLTCDAKLAAPWPWQVESVLNSLVGALIAANIDDYERAVMALPCTTAADRAWVLRTLWWRATGSPSASPALLAIWRNLILNGQPLSGFANATVRRWNEPRAEGFGEVIAIDAARVVGSIELASLAFEVANLRSRPPATAFLAIADRALNDASLPLFDRVYTLGYLGKAVDDPPFPPLGIDVRPTDTAELNRRDGLFRQWLAAHRAALERQAAAARPAIDEARREMQTITFCR